MANIYRPFPQSLSHLLRQASDVIESPDAKSEKVYILRNLLAEAYMAGHQEGFQVGMEHQYISTERQPKG